MTSTQTPPDPASRRRTSPFIAGFVVLVVLVILWFLYRLLSDKRLSVSDPVQQALWVDLSLVIILVVLLAFAVVLHWTDRDGTRGALGLPELCRYRV